ncbi:MAG TPA: PAS domain S-box protein, partial [Aggregatilineales bacterium]|nr:PAS domain S-box protein [Aggregatilineales bacterium]
MTEPPPGITLLNQRRQVRLLRSMLLVLALSAWVIVLDYWLAEFGKLVVVQESPLEASYLLLLPGLYLLSGHTRHYRTIAAFLIVVTTISVYIIAIPPDRSTYQTGLLVYLLVPILMSVSFMSETVTIGLILLNISGIIVFAKTQTHSPVNDTEIGYLTLVSILIVTIFYSQRLMFDMQQRQLAASERRYRQFVEIAPDPILVFGKEHLLFANPVAVEFLRQTSEGAVMGKAIAELWGKTDFSGLRVVIDDCLNGETRSAEETEFVLPDGNRVPVECSHSRIEYDNQAACLLIVRDIRERKHADQQRIQLELEREKMQMFQDFVGEISHDLKTPLTVILTKLSLLRRQIAQTPHIRYVDSAVVQCNRMRRLIEDFVTVLRLDR